jgi:hypothetical protein
MLALLRCLNHGLPAWPCHPIPTMRMQMRRFMRLTNAFSKKLSNLRAAVALHFAHYKLRANSSQLARDSCHGRWRVGSAIVYRGTDRHRNRMSAGSTWHSGCPPEMEFRFPDGVGDRYHFISNVANRSGSESMHRGADIHSVSKKRRT